MPTPPAASKSVIVGDLETEANRTRRSLFRNEIGYRNLVRHLPESVLEAYAMRRLSRYRADRVEERVQSCRECRERLETEIGIVAMMKAAGERFQRMRGRSRLQSVQALSGRRKG